MGGGISVQMEYFVNKLDPNYNFTIDGVSYIGNPRENTAVYRSEERR